MARPRPTKYAQTFNYAWECIHNQLRTDLGTEFQKTELNMRISSQSLLRIAYFRSFLSESLKQILGWAKYLVSNVLRIIVCPTTFYSVESCKICNIRVVHLVPLTMMPQLIFFQEDFDLQFWRYVFSYKRTDI